MSPDLPQLSLESYEEGIPEILATSEIRLIAVLQALKKHYGKDDQESLKVIDAAKEELEYLLTAVPQGIVWVTHSSKEGIFVHENTLQGKEPLFAPLYVVKRLEDIGYAERINWLGSWLETERERRKEHFILNYLNTPRTNWPLQLSDYSAIFSDFIQGENLTTLMPRINSSVLEGSKEAKEIKDHLVSLILDNIAYWQIVSQDAASESGYQLENDKIPEFTRNAIVQSATSLEQLTNVILQKDEREKIEVAAQRLASMVSPNGALSLDTGPSNIIIGNELIGDLENFVSGDISNAKYGQINIGKGIWHVDLPYQWKTVHEFRDVVRLLFSPALNLSLDEAIRMSYYTLIRKQYMQARTQEERNPATMQIGQFFDEDSLESMPTIHNYIRENPYDLLIVAAAEAARMNTIIPYLFLSKIKAEMDGRLPPSADRNDLETKYNQTVKQNRDWARVGLEVTRKLKGLSGKPYQDVIEGLEILYSRWEQAVVEQRKLPVYQPFMTA